MYTQATMQAAPPKWKQYVQLSVYKFLCKNIHRVKVIALQYFGQPWEDSWELHRKCMDFSDHYDTICGWNWHFNCYLFHFLICLFEVVSNLISLSQLNTSKWTKSKLCFVWTCMKQTNAPHCALCEHVWSRRMSPIVLCVNMYEADKCLPLCFVWTCMKQTNAPPLCFVWTCMKQKDVPYCALCEHV